jgi:hypothetical protein
MQPMKRYTDVLSRVLFVGELPWIEYPVSKHLAWFIKKHFKEPFTDLKLSLTKKLQVAYAIRVPR